MRPGPPLEPLLRRLLETPSDFLLDPRIDRGRRVEGDLHVDALVNDTLVDLGGEPLEEAEARALRDAGRAAALRLSALVCWLLHDRSLRDLPDLAAAARLLLSSGLDAHAAAVRPGDWVTDPDRREELVRLVLDRLGLAPEGEREEVARDRLRSLDSVERLALVRAMAEAEKRAREVREAAARAAAEAAAYYGRE